MTGVISPESSPISTSACDRDVTELCRCARLVSSERTLVYDLGVIGAAALGVGGYILLAGSPESSHVSARLTTEGGASGAF